MFDSKKKRIIVVIFLSIVLFSFICVLVECNHDCIYIDDCPICLLMQKAADNLNYIGTTVIFIIFVFLCDFTKDYILKNIIINSLTLINLKVRMNN